MTIHTKPIISVKISLTKTNESLFLIAATEAQILACARQKLIGLLSFYLLLLFNFLGVYVAS